MTSCSCYDLFLNKPIRILANEWNQQAKQLSWIEHHYSWRQPPVIDRTANRTEVWREIVADLFCDRSTRTLRRYGKWRNIMYSVSPPYSADTYLEQGKHAKLQVTVCDLQKSFSFEMAVKITRRVLSDSGVNISQLIVLYFPPKWPSRSLKVIGIDVIR